MLLVGNDLPFLARAPLLFVIFAEHLERVLFPFLFFASTRCVSNNPAALGGVRLLSTVEVMRVTLCL